MYPQYPDDYRYYYPQSYNQYPMMYKKPSLLENMKYSVHQFSMSSTLRTTQRTLYTVNQIIPIIYQLRPVIQNASTAFKIVKTVKQFDFDEIDKEISNNFTDESETDKNVL